MCEYSFEGVSLEFSREMKWKKNATIHFDSDAICIFQFCEQQSFIISRFPAFAAVRIEFRNSIHD